MGRRKWIAGVALASTVCAARADLAPPPVQFVTVAAAGLSFQVVLRDYSRPVRRVAELVGCVDGQPNCALARSKNLIGMKVQGIDGQNFRDDSNVAEQLIGAFHRDGAPATIELDFESNASTGEPVKVEFSRR
ncbi:MAG: hypothetical protein ABSC22_14150 [Roseiarcus sp.]|jgi:hypothetical protein